MSAEIAALVFILGSIDLYGENRSFGCRFRRRPAEPQYMGSTPIPGSNIRLGLRIIVVPVLKWPGESLSEEGCVTGNTRRVCMTLSGYRSKLSAS
jgi:hypothetical protein